VAVLHHHREIVRDCSWHPHEPELVSVSWDGTVVQWDAAAPGAGPADSAEAALRREAAGYGDRFDGMY
jgi:WD repeat-containing protein 23